LVKLEKNQEIAAAKSYFSHQLVATLVHGGEWLRFKSAGEFKVVIVDVELTRRQLVKRFQSTIGESGGLVRIMTPEKMDGRFPRLLDPAHQEKLVEELKSFGAQILVIDSLTAAFRIDTNNQDHLAAINDFLRRLKIVHRLCVIILHHAGKNTTQRGRSDTEDHLETVIKLTPLPDALPGEIRVKFEYEKETRGRGGCEFRLRSPERPMVGDQRFTHGGNRPDAAAG